MIEGPNYLIGKEAEGSPTHSLTSDASPVTTPGTLETTSGTSDSNAHLDQLIERANLATQKKQEERNQRCNELKRELLLLYPEATITEIERTKGMQQGEDLDSGKIGPFLITTTQGEKIVAKAILVDHIDPRIAFREEQFARLLEHQSLGKGLGWKIIGAEFTAFYRYVEGKSLAEIGQLPVESVLPIATQVLKVFKYLNNPSNHPYPEDLNRVLVHRDIKPSNILVDDKGHVTVIDLGAATARSLSGLQNGDATRTLVLGTRKYAAPEVWTGNPQPASDIYSLGVTLIEILHGTLPQPLTTHTYDAQYVIPEDFKVILVPGGQAENIPPDLRIVLQRMISKDLSIRYTSADQVIDDIQSLKTELVHSREQSLSNIQSRLIQTEMALKLRLDELEKLRRRQKQLTNRGGSQSERDVGEKQDDSRKKPDFWTMKARGQALSNSTTNPEKPDPKASEPQATNNYMGSVRKASSLVPSPKPASDTEFTRSNVQSQSIGRFSVVLPPKKHSPQETLANSRIWPPRDPSVEYTLIYDFKNGSFSERPGIYGAREVLLKLKNVEATATGMTDKIEHLAKEIEDAIWEKYPKPPWLGDENELVWANNTPMLQGDVTVEFTPFVEDLPEEAYSRIWSRTSLSPLNISSRYQAYRSLLGPTLIPAETNFLRLWLLCQRLSNGYTERTQYDGRSFLTVDEQSQGRDDHTKQQVRFTSDRGCVISTPTHPIFLERWSAEQLIYFGGNRSCPSFDRLIASGREPGSMRGLDAEGNEVRL